MRLAGLSSRPRIKLAYRHATYLYSISFAELAESASPGVSPQQADPSFLCLFVPKDLTWSCMYTVRIEEHDISYLTIGAARVREYIHRFEHPSSGLDITKNDLNYFL